jgi:3-keto-5-aminohexanoate cleavage enzyme
MPDPAVLSCAVSGGMRTGNPHQPTTRDEVIDAVLGAARAGASIAHIHARSDDGEITQSAAVYDEIRERVRAAGSDIVLNFTTGGALGMSFDERREALRGGPEVASLNAGSLNFGPNGDIYPNPRWFIDELADEMAERRIMPEYECFELGMAITAAELSSAAPSPGMMHMVLGVTGGAPASVELLCQFAALVPNGTPWMATGIGRHNFPIMAATLARGGHVRTGLEDVVWMARGRYATSNAELVERAVALCKAVGRPVATPQQARELLQIDV